ncbi:hypothetical protein K431DRAFT_117224 [Polychaeton citri CBS 116435]|uniref:Uncharacterized protein n=1 Tax=Polychaeton citri CBS 116435 TaxID=1314669 RepID=A0A9P4QHK5_9PEZI|nr:hypothetical protein K431DRAFT_117224 [Polychaeton citri CBS 116435]
MLSSPGACVWLGPLQMQIKLHQARESFRGADPDCSCVCALLFFFSLSVASWHLDYYVLLTPCPGSKPAACRQTSVMTSVPLLSPSSSTMRQRTATRLEIACQRCIIYRRPCHMRRHREGGREGGRGGRKRGT